ncbi:Segregation and condensation protein B [Chitinispirillum alkaliphilum]|nr:Segregation and condensation protein B [Chitinispirillum alkaliphilum]
MTQSDTRTKNSSQKQQPSADKEPKNENSAEDYRILEALLFASDEILSPAKLKSIIPGEPDLRKLRKMVEKINVQLQKERHPFEIVEVAGGFQFRTIAYYHPWIRQIFKEKAAKKLSMQALECLAIIAYRQPLSKAEIEAIRGVVSDGAMKTLLERRLITISGRSDKPGRPLLYSTTQEFLHHFGLNKISDLPKIEEFEALAKEKMEELSIDQLEEGEEDQTDTEQEGHSEEKSSQTASEPQEEQK